MTGKQLGNIINRYRGRDCEAVEEALLDIYNALNNSDDFYLPSLYDRYDFADLMRSVDSGKAADLIVRLADMDEYNQMRPCRDDEVYWFDDCEQLHAGYICDVLKDSLDMDETVEYLQERAPGLLDDLKNATNGGDLALAA